MSSTSQSDAAFNTSQDANTAQDSHTSLSGKGTGDGNSLHSDGPSPGEVFRSNCSATIDEALELIAFHGSLTSYLTQLFEELEQGQWIVTQRQDSASSGHFTFSKRPGQSSGLRYMVSWWAKLSAVDESELKGLQKQHCSAADIAAKRLDLIMNGGESFLRLQVFNPTGAASAVRDDHLRTLVWETTYKWHNPPDSTTTYTIMDGQAEIDLWMRPQGKGPRGSVDAGNRHFIANPESWLPLPLNGLQENWQELLEGLTVTNRFDKYRKSNPSLPWSASLEKSGYVWSAQMRRMLNDVAEYDSFTSAHTAANEQAFCIPSRGSGTGHVAVEMCTTGASFNEAHKIFAWVHTDKTPDSEVKPTDWETMTKGLYTHFTMSEIGLDDVGGEREPFKFNWDTIWKWVPEQSWQSTYTVTCGKAFVMMSCNDDGMVHAFGRDSDGKVVEDPAQSLPRPGRGREELFDIYRR